ncbi:MAG: WD40/YVTN/BNR-like repeat-containing protein [Gemmatimonadales bacterium]
MTWVVRNVSSRTLLATAISIITLGGFTNAVAQQITPDLYSGLKYRYIGPIGNRTSAVVGVPGDPMVYYVGASSGGIFKSVDAGLNWTPIFDDQPAQSIGALAIAPSDPNIVWAGTGEAWVRSNISIGNGVYKSTDAGRTWQHMGLDRTGRIGRIVIDPRDPNIVHVAAVGHSYGPQQERGVFRTTDGGKTWEHTLFVDENTGAFEIAMNPSNPRILFAGTWPLVIRTWGRESGGPGGGIYRSRDGGATWQRLEGHGLPKPPIGKVGLAIAPSNPEVVYALMETGHPNRGVLWRSHDGGDNWTLVSYDRILNERPHYASRVMVSPADENEVYFAANSHSISYDGGVTTERSGWGGDTHDMWADPLIPDRMMISSDGGAMITLNRGKSWNRIALPDAQMYHVSVDNQVPYYVYGGMQDRGSWKGPSTEGLGRGRFRRGPSQWAPTAGGESGFIVVDPVDHNIVWGGSYMGGLTKVDYRTGFVRSVKVWPEADYGASAGEVKYRFNWTFPITISPHDHNKVYVGSQYVHQTTDGGESWTIISPDLSTNDPSKLVSSGGLTKDNIGVEYAELVFAIAESPLEAGLIWAGTNDGLVHVTRDGGGTWTNVTKNIPDLPEWGTVSNIEPSRYDAGTAYITVDFHQMNNRDPFIYKTTDYGKSWKSISSDIPKSVFSYVHWIAEDPVRQGLLYVGTENAIYVSFDDGRHWLPLQNNLPHAPVHHMVVQEQFNDLVLATYGRGFWIMDDITPLQQLTNDVLASDAHLFQPRPAYRMHSVTGGPRGNATAYINYYLKSKPTGKVQVSILNDRGETIRTLEGTKRPGINRVRWDLRHEPVKQARLRTKPPGNPHVVEEKRFRTTWEREGWFPILSWGTGGGFQGIMVAPGTYTAKLTVGDSEYTQQLVVRKDPRSEGTVADIQAQVALQLELRDDIKTTAGMIDDIEGIKKQLNDLKDALDGDDGAAVVVRGADSLYAKLQAVEDKILQPIAAEGDSKSFRFPNRLYSKLSVLAGDVANSVDFAPNAQQREVHDVLKARMLEYQAELKQVLDTDLAAFNRLVRDRNMVGVITTTDGGAGRH